MVSKQRLPPQTEARVGVARVLACDLQPMLITYAHNICTPGMIFLYAKYMLSNNNIDKLGSKTLFALMHCLFAMCEGPNLVRTVLTMKVRALGNVYSLCPLQLVQLQF